MTINFTTPITLGSYPNQITVSQVQLAAISFNFEKVKSSAGTGVVSIQLEDPVSGLRVANPQFNSAAVLTLVKALLAASNGAVSFEESILKLAQQAMDPLSPTKTMVPPGTIAP